MENEMYPTIEELEDLIEQLNHEISPLDDNLGLYFEVNSVGYARGIKFADIPLWDSENDEREWDDIKDEPEPLEPYIRREAMRLFRAFAGIKL